MPPLRMRINNKLAREITGESPTHDVLASSFHVCNCRVSNYIRCKSVTMSETLSLEKALRVSVIQATRMTAAMIPESVYMDIRFIAG